MPLKQNSKHGTTTVMIQTIQLPAVAVDQVDSPVEANLSSISKEEVDTNSISNSILSDFSSEGFETSVLFREPRWEFVSLHGWMDRDLWVTRDVMQTLQKQVLTG